MRWIWASADGRRAIYQGANMVRLHSLPDGKVLRTLVTLRDGLWALVSPDGHLAGSPGVEKEFVYVVLTESGEQLTLSPEEFAKKYGWKNDPEKAWPPAAPPTP